MLTRFSATLAIALATTVGLAVERVFPTDLNVRDFGAVGDGVHDDTAAIQAAADKQRERTRTMCRAVGTRFNTSKCPDGPIVRIVFPSGTYRITAPVFFVRDAQLQGIGQPTILQADPQADVFVFQGALRSHVENLAFEGGRRQVLVDTFNDESSNFKVRDCAFSRSTGAAVESFPCKKDSTALDVGWESRIGNYRYDKDMKRFVPDERLNRPDLLNYANSTFFTVERCAFRDCAVAAAFACDGAVMREVKVTTSVSTGVVFRVDNCLHAYGLDVLVKRPNGADLAIFEAKWFKCMLEHSRFRTMDGSGVCLMRSRMKPSYYGSYFILRDCETECGGCPEGAIVRCLDCTAPEIVAVSGVRDVSGRPVKAIRFDDGLTAKRLAEILHFSHLPADRIYSFAIGRNSPNVDEGLPDCCEPFHEAVGNVPPAPKALKVPSSISGEIVWAEEFGALGGSNDTFVLQRALSAAQALKRPAVVVLPPKWISMTDSLRVGGQVTVTGAGVAALHGLGPDRPYFRVANGARFRLSHVLTTGGSHAVSYESENAGETHISVDCVMSYDAAVAGFAAEAKRNADRVKLRVDGGVHYHSRFYEGNVDAELVELWYRLLPPTPATKPLNRCVGVVNRGKLLFQDVLGVPIVFNRYRGKGGCSPEIPKGDYRWIDNRGGDLHCVGARFGGEFGGISPVYNSDGGRVTIEGGYAYYWARFVPHAAVTSDSEWDDQIRMFGVLCHCETMFDPRISFKWRKSPEDELRPLAAQNISCVRPKPFPAVKAVVTSDWSSATGPIKPVNAVGQPPMAGAPRKYRMMHYLTEAGIPYARLHDVGGAFGQNRYVDIPNVFRDFEADENNSANYDFAYTDTLMKALDEAGVEPFYRLGVTIENFTELPTHWTSPPKDFAKWARVCEHVVRHYTEGWANGFRMKVSYWEIWNEPDNHENPEKNQMWRAPFSEYLRFYGTVAPYLKSKFPHLKIGGPALCGLYAGILPAASCSPRTQYHLKCANEFLAAARKNGWPLDFFSYHGYTMPDGGAKMARFVRGMLDEAGFGQTEVCFNEWLSDVALESLGTARQAASVGGMLLALQSSPCDTAMIYDAKCDAGVYAPLFNPMTEKPHKAYYAFVAFNALRRLGTAVSCSSTVSGVWAVAAKGKLGRALMVVNTTGLAYRLAIPEISAARCHLVDEKKDWAEVESPVELPAHALLLCEFSE